MPSRMPGIMGMTLLAVSSLALFALGGCAARQPVMEQGTSLSPSDEWRLQTLEEKFLAFKEGRLARQAEMDRMRELLESVDRREARTEDDVRDIQARLDALEKQAPAAAGQSATAPRTGAATGDGQVWSDVPATPEPMAKPAPKPMAKSKPVAKPAKMAAAEPAAYTKALDMILGGKLEQGRKAMQSFLAANPKSPLAANAQYWIGESYYGQRNDAQAIVEFKQVYQRYPKHPKAAAALLKIGYSYERLGDKDNARFYLEALLEDYPKSKPASLAKSKLATLSN